MTCGGIPVLHAVKKQETVFSECSAIRTCVCTCMPLFIVGSRIVRQSQNGTSLPDPSNTRYCVYMCVCVCAHVSV